MTSQSKNTLLTAEQEQFVRDNYPKLTRMELTAALNAKFNLSIKLGQLISFVKNHKITSGRTGLFKKGAKPWNTGTKGKTSGSSTSFKKGNVPANIKPLGHERICPKDGYILIKVKEINPYTGAPTRYKHKQLVVWEEHNGPVPEGHVVTFKDNDRLNCAIENLLLLTRSELAVINKMQLSQVPADMKKTVQLLAQLKMKSAERMNGKKEAAE